MNILFVCTGNTCRSPMAEVLLKDKAPHLFVQSAGIFASPNEEANQNAIKALEERGLKIDHSAQTVTKKLLNWADLVLTMTEGHKRLLIDQFPEYQNKYNTLIEFSTNNQNGDIIDPFGGDLFKYEQTLSEMEKYIEAIIKKIDT
ncbi:low molecular weight protein arginine phosphatase [Pseudogracilibacillus sp. SE30717A]|uniref:low molecular weight protein arginine phosphatase n=1 Tax=Pseudogracilibacillus sp. SE30717A TaxID=3098293 RepID=UPI003FA7DBAD